MCDSQIWRLWWKFLCLPFICSTIQLNGEYKWKFFHMGDIAFLDITIGIGGIYIQILSLDALSFVTHKLSIKRVCYLVYLSRMTKVPRTLGI